MPQTKEAKRKTAIKLYEQAIVTNRSAIADGSSASSIVILLERRIKNLQKHIDQTLAKH